MWSYYNKNIGLKGWEGWGWNIITKGILYLLYLLSKTMKDPPGYSSLEIGFSSV